MELPNIGDHCSEVTCNRLDFLAVKCDSCQKLFCKDHMKYSQHACPNARSKDIQVPVCPLCNKPVPSPRNQAPDIAVGDHIDRDCQSATAKTKRKRKTCYAFGCKVREIIPVLCSDCNKNFCLRHRFPDQHKCEGSRGRAAEAAQQRLQAGSVSSSLTAKVQGNMSEDEALARALAESMKYEQRPPQRVAAGGPSSSNSQCQVS